MGPRFVLVLLDLHDCTHASVVDTDLQPSVDKFHFRVLSLDKLAFLGSVMSIMLMLFGCIIPSLSRGLARSLSRRSLHAQLV